MAASKFYRIFQNYSETTIEILKAEKNFVLHWKVFPKKWKKQI